jgi:ABC-2 type transport system ATP-binding protein
MTGMTPLDSSRTAALAVDHVSHRYGARVALNDVSLAVRQSSFTVLLGLNGAGKSTLFSLITRLYAIRSGQIRIFGHDVGREAGAALSQLGVVFQSRADILDHVRRLSAEQGLGVLWATHLIDEANAGDDVVVLHKGSVLAQGTVADVVGQSGAADLRAAFNRLTGTADQGELEAAQ